MMRMGEDVRFGDGMDMGLHMREEDDEDNMQDLGLDEDRLTEGDEEEDEDEDEEVDEEDAMTDDEAGLEVSVCKHCSGPSLFAQ